MARGHGRGRGRGRPPVASSGKRGRPRKNSIHSLEKSSTFNYQAKKVMRENYLKSEMVYSDLPSWSAQSQSSPEYLLNQDITRPHYSYGTDNGSSLQKLANSDISNLSFYSSDDLKNATHLQYCDPLQDSDAIVQMNGYGRRAHKPPSLSILTNGPVNLNEMAEDDDKTPEYPLTSGSAFFTSSFKPAKNDTSKDKNIFSMFSSVNDYEPNSLSQNTSEVQLTQSHTDFEETVLLTNGNIKHKVHRLQMFPKQLIDHRKDISVPKITDEMVIDLIHNGERQEENIPQLSLVQETNEDALSSPTCNSQPPELTCICHNSSLELHCQTHSISDSAGVNNNSEKLSSLENKVQSPTRRTSNGDVTVSVHSVLDLRREKASEQPYKNRNRNPLHINLSHIAEAVSEDELSPIPLMVGEHQANSAISPYMGVSHDGEVTGTKLTIPCSKEQLTATTKVHESANQSPNCQAKQSLCLVNNSAMSPDKKDLPPVKITANNQEAKMFGKPVNQINVWMTDEDNISETQSMSPPYVTLSRVPLLHTGDSVAEKARHGQESYDTQNDRLNGLCSHSDSHQMAEINHMSVDTNHGIVLMSSKSDTSIDGSKKEGVSSDSRDNVTHSSMLHRSDANSLKDLLTDNAKQKYSTTIPSATLSSKKPINEIENLLNSKPNFSQKVNQIPHLEKLITNRENSRQNDKINTHDSLVQTNVFKKQGTSPTNKVTDVSLSSGAIRDGTVLTNEHSLNPHDKFDWSENTSQADYSWHRHHNTTDKYNTVDLTACTEVYNVPCSQSHFQVSSYGNQGLAESRQPVVYQNKDCNRQSPNMITKGARLHYQFKGGQNPSQLPNLLHSKNVSQNFPVSSYQQYTGHETSFHYPHQATTPGHYHSTASRYLQPEPTSMARSHAPKTCAKILASGFSRPSYSMISHSPYPLMVDRTGYVHPDRPVSNLEPVLSTQHPESHQAPMGCASYHSFIPRDQTLLSKPSQNHFQGHHNAILEARRRQPVVDQSLSKEIIYPSWVLVPGKDRAKTPDQTTTVEVVKDSSKNLIRSPNVYIPNKFIESNVNSINPLSAEIDQSKKTPNKIPNPLSLSAGKNIILEEPLDLSCSNNNMNEETISNRNLGAEISPNKASEKNLSSANKNNSILNSFNYGIEKSSSDASNREPYLTITPNVSTASTPCTIDDTRATNSESFTSCGRFSTASHLLSPKNTAPPFSGLHDFKVSHSSHSISPGPTDDVLARNIRIPLADFFASTPSTNTYSSMMLAHIKSKAKVSQDSLDSDFMPGAGLNLEVSNDLNNAVIDLTIVEDDDVVSISSNDSLDEDSHVFTPVTSYSITIQGADHGDTITEPIEQETFSENQRHAPEMMSPDVVHRDPEINSHLHSSHWQEQQQTSSSNSSQNLKVCNSGRKLMSEKLKSAVTLLPSTSDVATNFVAQSNSFLALDYPMHARVIEPRVEQAANSLLMLSADHYYNLTPESSEKFQEKVYQIQPFLEENEMNSSQSTELNRHPPSAFKPFSKSTRRVGRPPKDDYWPKQNEAKMVNSDSFTNTFAGNFDPRLVNSTLSSVSMSLIPPSSNRDVEHGFKSHIVGKISTHPPQIPLDQQDGDVHVMERRIDPKVAQLMKYRLRKNEESRHVDQQPKTSNQGSWRASDPDRQSSHPSQSSNFTNEGVKKKRKRRTKKEMMEAAYEQSLNPDKKPRRKYKSRSKVKPPHDKQSTLFQKDTTSLNILEVGSHKGCVDPEIILTSYISPPATPDHSRKNNSSSLYSSLSHPLQKSTFQNQSMRKPSRELPAGKGNQVVRQGGHGDLASIELFNHQNLVTSAHDEDGMVVISILQAHRE